MPLIPTKKKAQTVFNIEMDENGLDLDEKFELRSIAESMMDALKDGSVEKLVSALEAFCEYDEKEDKKMMMGE